MSRTPYNIKLCYFKKYYVEGDEFNLLGEFSVDELPKLEKTVYENAMKAREKHDEAIGKSMKMFSIYDNMQKNKCRDGENENFPCNKYQEAYDNYRAAKIAEQKERENSKIAEEECRYIIAEFRKENPKTPKVKSVTYNENTNVYIVVDEARNPYDVDVIFPDFMNDDIKTFSCDCPSGEYGCVHIDAVLQKINKGF